METNKIDTIVKDSLQSRTIQPSNSAWERLSNLLDEKERPKQINWFKYAGIAASILLLISVGFFMNTTDDIDPIIPTEVVTAPIIDTAKLVKPSFNTVMEPETVIVQANKVEEKKKIKREIIITKNNSTDLKVPAIVKENSRIVIVDNANNTETKQDVNKRIKIDSNTLLMAVTDTKKVEEKTTKITIIKDTIKSLRPSRMYIDSDALLYAVSNPDKDINEYYKKYNINRDDVLKNIQNQLKKSNLIIDANIILVDVEKTIDEETFKKSFMQVLKGKVTDLASAFANRNN